MKTAVRDWLSPVRAKASLLVEYSLVLAAAGLLAMNIETSGVTLNGRMWPLVVLVLLGLIASLLLLITLLAPAPGDPDGTAGAPGENDGRGRPGRRYAMMAVYAGFVVLLPSLGFALATAAFVPVAARMLGMPPRIKHIALSLCIAIAIYLLFSAVFSIPLPEGRLVRLPSLL